METRKKIKETKKKFGDVRFDYIKSCTHEFKSYAQTPNCPFCKLITISTTNLKKEEEKRLKNSRAQGKISSTIKKISALENWLRSQSSFYDENDNLDPHIDLTFSSSTVTALMKRPSTIFSSSDASQFYKLLVNRKKRIEVGIYAAVFLQSRIRKLLSKVKVRKMLLRRIKYVAATNYKPHFFVDTLKQRKMNRYPSLLLGERPATPTTITRRLNVEENKRDARWHRYLHSIQQKGDDDEWEARPVDRTEEDGDDGDDTWSREAKLVSQEFQLIILRDIVAASMLKLEGASPYSHTGLKETQPSVSSPQANAYLIDSNTAIFPPVWICLSTYSSNPRLIGTSIVLSGPSPFPPIQEEDLSLSLSRPPTARPTPTPTPTIRSNINAINSGEGNNFVENNYNSRLREFEWRVWTALRCSSPEQVVERLMCSEARQAMGTALSFLNEELGVWRGQRVLPNKFLPVHLQEAGNSSIPQPKSAEDQTDELSPRSHSSSSIESTYSSFSPEEILPISLQIRPCFEGGVWGERGPNGLFRLFFKRGYLVAATPISQYTFYPEILMQRDQILSHLKSFASSSPIRSLVGNILLKANQDSRFRPKISTSSSFSSSPPPSIHGYIPQVEEICAGLIKGVGELAADPAFCLTDDQVLKINENHSFLKKSAGWQVRLRAALSNVRQRNKLSTYRQQLMAAEKESAQRALRQEALEGRFVAQKLQFMPIPMPVPMPMPFPPSASSSINETLQIEFQRKKEYSKSPHPPILEIELPSEGKSGGGGGGGGLSLGNEPQERWKGVKLFETLSAELEAPSSSSSSDILALPPAYPPYQPSIYLRCLQNIVEETDLDLPRRIRRLQEPVLPSYDLVVLDVSLSLRRPRDVQSSSGSAHPISTPSTNLPPLQSSQPSSRAPSRGRPPGDATADRLMPILHQTIGVFSTSNPAPPPTLDLGLIEWTWLRAHLAPTKGPESRPPADEFVGSIYPTPSTPTPASTPLERSREERDREREKDRQWSQPNERTGISTHRGIFSGADFQMKVLAMPPSREVIEKGLSKKVKNWLGIP